MSEEDYSNSENSEDDICTHAQKTNIDGTVVCNSCGEQLDEDLLEEQYYISGNSAPRHNHRKDPARSLYPDLESRGFPQNIIERANYYYTRIIKDSIYRSKNRTAIVFICCLRAYEDLGDPINANALAQRFGLDKKGVSKGLLIFADVFKNELTKKHLKPMDLVPKILSDLGIKDQSVYMNDINIIYNKASSNSIEVQKAIPQSSAAGLVYYYLKLRNHPIEKPDYSKIVHLTDITFTKVATDYGRALDYPIKL